MTMGAAGTARAETIPASAETIGRPIPLELVREEKFLEYDGIGHTGPCADQCLVRKQPNWTSWLETMRLTDTICIL